MAERTENYGLTIWGKEDEYTSPAGLNRNFEMVDEVLASKAEGTAISALQGKVTALVATLGAMAVVAGTYQGKVSPNTGVGDATEIVLGFRPKAVLAGTNSLSTPFVNVAVDGADTNYLKITDTGFTAVSTLNLTDGSSSGRNPYRYLVWR